MLIRELSLAVAPREVLALRNATGSFEMMLAAAALSPWRGELGRVAKVANESVLESRQAQLLRSILVERALAPEEMVNAYGWNVDEALAANEASSPETLARLCVSADWDVHWRAWTNASSPVDAALEAMSSGGTTNRSWLGFSPSGGVGALDWCNGAEGAIHDEVAEWLIAKAGRGMALGALAMLGWRTGRGSEFLRGLQGELRASREWALHPMVESSLVPDQWRGEREAADCFWRALGAAGAGVRVPPDVVVRAAQLGACWIDEIVARSSPEVWLGVVSDRMALSSQYVRSGLLAETLESAPWAFGVVVGVAGPHTMIAAKRSALLRCARALSWTSGGHGVVATAAFAKELKNVLFEAQAALAHNVEAWEIWWYLLDRFDDTDVASSRRAIDTALTLAR